MEAFFQESTNGIWLTVSKQENMSDISAGFLIIQSAVLWGQVTDLGKLIELNWEDWKHDNQEQDEGYLAYGSLGWNVSVTNCGHRDDDVVEYIMEKVESNFRFGWIELPIRPTILEFLA